MIYGHDTLVFDDVKANLLSKDKLDNVLCSTSGSYGNSALMSRGRDQSRRDSGNRNISDSKLKDKEKFCRYCKRRRNEIKDCFNYRIKKRRNLLRMRNLLKRLMSILQR